MGLRRRRSRRGDIELLLAIGLVVGHGTGCTQRVRPDSGIYDCPLLVVPGGTHGAIASAGRFPEGACVELYLDGERLDQAFAGPGGALALQFLLARELPGGIDVELRASTDDTHVERVRVHLDARSEASIAYPADTTPLIVSGGSLVFRGSLEPAGTGSRLGRAWLVNWSHPAVAPISPTPMLSTPFTASVAGRRGDCASVVSSHVGGRGGCWWPRGGGGCAPICTEEELRSGACSGEEGTGTGTCVRGRGRGCGPIDVDEHRSGVPPPETDRTIPVAPPPAWPTDAGRPDAPVPDASLDAEPEGPPA